MNTIRRGVVFAVLSLAAVSLAAADVRLADLGDDSDLRSAYLQRLAESSPKESLLFRPESIALPDGSRARIRVEEASGEVLAVFSRATDSGFLDYAQGSWTVYRDASGGKFRRMRWFLRTDPYSFLQIRRGADDRAVADLVAYGAFLAREVPLPYSFDIAIAEPLARIMRASRISMPWRYFDPEPALYDDARSLADAIRSGLSRLSYEDDGALDAEGRAVFIENGEPQSGAGGLNCSGFAKWVVDGLIRAVTGKRLGIEPLKMPPEPRGSSFSEPYEESEDPYFGLDWTRNLARAAFSVLRDEKEPRSEDYDVTRTAVVSLRSRGGDGAVATSYPGYRDDAGFPIEALEAMLYGLAIDEPGYFYLGSINKDLGSAPRLRKHFHVAVLIPYFDEAGRFRVALFESAVETKLTSFVRRYPGGHIHLVRVPLAGEFEP